MPQPILIAVAWPYAQGPRHIGHVAGFGVPADILARYHRLCGNRVLMVSGTDEHGTPITVAADREGVDPQVIVDRYSQVIAEDLRRLGLSYDCFTRTTTRLHAEVVQDLFLTLLAKGYVFRQATMGAFAASTGRTLPDRYIEGTCPHCGHRGARGDQCEACGRQLDPSDLIDPRSLIDGQPPVFRETEHFFLDLPQFAAPLRQWIEAQTHWRPNVRSFSLNLLDELRPRAYTRDIGWGVAIPLPEFAERSDKRIYVWFDAVVGYLSASVEWARAEATPEAWRDFWQNPAARHYYVMGKDNIVFHTIIWPSMLLGYGSGGEFGGGPERPALELPDDIVSSEFLTMESRKFSSSRGVGILVGDFLDRYDPDPLRYYLCAAGPESQDTDFTWAEFVRRNNDELVATWGNLVNRTCSLAQRHFGAVPALGEPQPADRSVLEAVAAGYGVVGGLIASAHLKSALGEAMALAAQVNQYLGEQEPWRVVTRDRDRAATILNVALTCVDNLKVLLAPFLPFSSEQVHRQLGHEGVLTGAPHFAEHPDGGGRSHRVLTGEYGAGVGRWTWQTLTVGQPLLAPQPLYKKLDPSVVDDELRRMGLEPA
ncbi:MAG TPA: methionine--tRNA ligase [Verrucomicrobiae bacterium]|nr:methionine--tRNA ligase [Verrucomicrobiae bacterium]